MLPCASVSIAGTQPRSGTTGWWGGGMGAAPFGGGGVAEPFVKLLTGGTSVADARGGLVPVSIGV